MSTRWKARSGRRCVRMFENFWGNAPVTEALERMIAQDRVPQSLLLAGPEGIGKATLARRLAARLLAGAGAVRSAAVRHVRAAPSRRGNGALQRVDEAFRHPAKRKPGAVSAGAV